MKKFFVIVLCAAAAAILGYGIKYAITPVNTQPVEYTTHENLLHVKGYIVLDEWMPQARSAGTFYHSVSEGERVSKDSGLGEYFYGDVPENSIQELAVIDSRIKNARADSRDQSIVDLDSNTVESNIFRRENDIIDANEENDILSISKYKRDINSLRAKNELSSEDTVPELEERRTQLLGSIGVMKEEIYSEIAGEFSMYTDGYEDQLRFDRLGDYTVDYYDSLSPNTKMQKIESRVEPGQPICKVVNNHVFYIMTAVKTSEMEGHRTGDSVNLRFNSMAGITKKGLIRSISDDQDGRVLVILQCPEYLEDAFSYRVADVDVIFSSYTGYKVPVQAIRTEEGGKQKVIGIKGNVEYDCYFDEIYTYTDGGYAIVRSSDSAEHKLSDMERILVGER